jgi:hypothetical protein
MTEVFALAVGVLSLPLCSVGISPVCTENLSSGVVVMKSAHDGK